MAPGEVAQHHYNACHDQHANNAIYNLVTVVIEERLALVVKRTDAFIYGDFSDAAAALETA